MTSRQRAVFLVAALFCAATRVLAIARSPWDRDEVLFALALRDYDVTRHHPHPPGYPLFIGLAQLFGDNFGALQVVTFAAAVLVFPAVYLFARSCGSDFRTGVVAGLFCAFHPNVWYFGGTGFSDVPAMVLATFAAATGSAFLLGCSMAVRPQNLLVILRTRPRLTGVALGLIVLAVAYGAAVHATGSLDGFRDALRIQSDYVRRTDTFLNPERPSLLSMAERFFLKPYGPASVSIVLSSFIVIGLAARRRPVLNALLTFGPMAIFAWLMLDRFSAVRYAIAYAPMLAVIAAEGVGTVGRWIGSVTGRRDGPPASRRPDRQRPAGEELSNDERRRDGGGPAGEDAGGPPSAVIAVATVVFLILSTLPALRDSRNESPAVAAVRAAKTPLYVTHAMTDFVTFIRPELTFTQVLDQRAVSLSGEGWLLADVTEGPGNHRALWEIARRQNFDVRVVAIRSATFNGWGPAQREGHAEFRWLNGRGLIELPPARGETMLRLRLGVNGRVVVRLNGRVLDDRVAAGDIESDHVVVPEPTNVLEITTDREFGVRLQMLSWGPA